MKLFIWGTGAYAENFINYSKSIVKDVVGFIETEKSKKIFHGKTVYLPSQIKNEDFDFLIVANQYVDEIKSKIYLMDLDLEKTVFLPTVWIQVNIKEKRLCFNFENVSQSPKENSVFFPSFGLYSTSKEILSVIQQELSCSDYWSKLVFFDTSTNVPHIKAPLIKMLNEEYIPYLKKTDSVFDIACATGEWSRFISWHVKHVDGYDISQKMISNAIKISNEWGFDNISYTCNSADSIDTKKKYEHGMILGLFTCIDSDSDVEKIIRKSHSYIKKGGYLAVRDTLSMYTEMPIYFYTKSHGSTPHYLGIYRPLKKYISFFESVGFSLLEERYFHSYFHKPLEVGSHALIFRNS